MPIPFILGGLAILAGAAGVAKGIEAKETMEDAQEDNEEAQRIVKRARNKVKETEKVTKACIEDLSREKLKVMEGSMQSFVETYSKLKNVVLKDSVGMEELSNFTPESVGFQRLKVSSFNPSINMAIGMTVLGGGIAAPLLALSGFVMSAKASEAWSQAQENLERAETFNEKCQNACSLLKAIKTRANQIEKIIDRLDSYFQAAVTDLQKVVAESGTDFRKYSESEVIKVYKSVQYASAMKAVLDTSLLTEKGKLTDESAKCVETADEKLDALRRKEISVATSATPKKATNAVEKENNISASQDEPKTRKDCYEKGWELERHGDIAGAKRYYKMAADKGHIVAKNRLKFLQNK